MKRDINLTNQYLQAARSELALHKKLRAAIAAYKQDSTDNNKAAVDELLRQVAAAEEKTRSYGFADIEQPSIIHKPKRTREWWLAATAVAVITLVLIIIPIVWTTLSPSPIVFAMNTSSPDFTGVDSEVATRICEQFSCQLVRRETLPENTLLDVARGDYAMLADGVPINEQRAELVEYSIPYRSLYEIIIVRGTESRFVNAAEISEGDFIVGDYTEATRSTALDLVGGSRVRKFDSLDAAVEALTTGGVDAVIWDAVEAETIFRSGAQGGTLKRLNDRLAEEQYALAFPPGSMLVAEVNRIIRDLRSQGTMAEIYFASLMGAITVPSA